VSVGGDTYGWLWRCFVLELIAAVSAPSSLAIEAAQHSNITLCGFVRTDRATAYTHPERMQGFHG